MSQCRVIRGLPLRHSNPRHRARIYLLAVPFLAMALAPSSDIMFGSKLSTGTCTALGIGRDTQVGPGSTDLMPGAFRRGLIPADNAWQCCSQIRWQQPQVAVDPDTANLELYKPGFAAGINVFGLDNIMPLVQISASHHGHDRRQAADSLNSGFERLMFSPAIAFTRVFDEENNRVLTVYSDGRTTAGVNDAGGAVDCAVPVQDGPPQLARTQGEQWARFALPTL